MITADHFEEDFCWGVSSSAYQSEGGTSLDGKGLSIWDVFTRNKAGGDGSETVACDFYHRYMQDLVLMQYMNIGHFRFSLSWSRLMPEGAGRVNEHGVAFYNRLIDFCLELSIQPWITIYHWDLPHALEMHGGWTSRSIVQWFTDYVTLCVSRFGDRVKHWIVLAEPLLFTGGGYLLGLHAPGKRGLRNFLPALHHAILCQAARLNLIRSHAGLQAGASLTYCPIKPATFDERDKEAASSVDILVNRLAIERLFGGGYPLQDLKLLEEIEQYMLAGDEGKLAAEVDFITVQIYNPEIIRFSRSAPVLQARIFRPTQRGELSPQRIADNSRESLEKMIAAFGIYGKRRKIFITMSGSVCGYDQTDGKVHDPQRIAIMQEQLSAIVKAKRGGAAIAGYFPPSFTDEFHWSEGLNKRLGLVHVDYSTQRRSIKASGHWYRSFLGARGANSFPNQLAV